MDFISSYQNCTKNSRKCVVQKSIAKQPLWKGNLKKPSVNVKYIKYSICTFVHIFESQSLQQN